MSVQSPFNVEGYLETRQNNPSFTMVEVGHDSVPVAYQQPVPFLGNRAYIGIEAWLRDPANVKHQRVDELRVAEGGIQNIFYVAIDPGGISVREYEGEPSWYEGDYNPGSLLPEGVADEVLVCNVFGDPHIAFDKGMTQSLLSEVSRVVSKDGLIIVRESITPHHARENFNSDALEATGLFNRGVVELYDKDRWEKLDEVFKGDPSRFFAPQGSYYRFLSKVAGLAPQKEN